MYPEHGMHKRPELALRRHVQMGRSDSDLYELTRDEFIQAPAEPEIQAEAAKQYSIKW